MGEIFTNKIFTFPLDYDAYQHIREILIQLSSRFPLTMQESLELVNNRFKDFGMVDEEFFFHETPEAWSKIYYWGHENTWWKKGEERKKYNLPDLKPVRNDEIEHYELWESMEDNHSSFNYIYFPNRLLNDLRDYELFPNEYKKAWEVEANNYNIALELLHLFKGWRPYREE